MKLICIFPLIFIIFISFANSILEDEILKHSKVLACMFLLKKVMDNGNVDKQAFTLNLIKCYITIDISQINSILSAMQTGDEIVGSDIQYKELLNGEDIKKKKTIQEIQLLSSEINTAMKQLQQRQMGQFHDEFNEKQSQIGILSNMFIGLIKILAIDGYFKYGLMIIFGFLLLKSFCFLFRGNQRKKDVKIESDKTNKDKIQ